MGECPVLALLAAVLLPLSMSDPSLPCYATVTEAASEGLRQAVVVGGEYEAGGAIYRHGPLYCFTQPVTQGLAHAVDYRVGLVSPDKLIALFHTHPGKSVGVDRTDRFSPSDLMLANKMHCPMFVYVLELQRVIRYTP
jgi:hypothetical protein